MGVAEADPLVITADPLLLDQVLASAAVAGVEPAVVDEPGAARRLWHASPSVLVGLDQARGVTEQLLPRRPGVVLLGHEADRAALCGWSQPLGATTLALPAGVEWLSSVLAGDGVVESGGASVLAIAGGSGGVGASTLAVGLAQGLAARGSVIVIDADPDGGGLDLVLGVEQEPGWRWDRLATARGFVADLGRELPRREGVGVLAASRSGAGEPDGAAVSAVLRSAARGHDAVIVDLGRGGGPLAEQVLRHAGEVWLLAGCDVWSVAAARRAGERLGRSAAVRVITRERPWSDLGGRQVAELLGAPWLGSVPEDRQLGPGIEHGAGPLGAAGRRWRRRVEQLAAGIGAVP